VGASARTGDPALLSGREPRGNPSLAPEELRVALDVSAMLGGHVVVEMDRGDGTFGDARAAIDALIGIDEHLDAGEAAAAFALWNLSQLVERDRANDAVAGADVDARGVTRSNALLGDDVGHALAWITDRASCKVPN